MIDLFQVYICPVHGEVLEDEIELFENIDVENDEVYPEEVHMNCGRTVKPKLFEGGPCFQQVDQDRAEWYKFCNSIGDSSDDQRIHHFDT